MLHLQRSWFEFYLALYTANWASTYIDFWGFVNFITKKLQIVERIQKIVQVISQKRY